ncbi:HEAT repeat domain-containing protein [Kitasatospora sp. NPDC050543]|uniref:HEAT repeat domain-containing protein n=1 Tax=Kitasatospora sp. NPDC050543 TaxID=3364054 RepID=UPI0037A8C968
MNAAGSTAELVGQALAALLVAEESNESDDWDEYGALLWRAAADGESSLSLGLELTGSKDPVEREVGCDLLGNASDQHEAVRAESAAALAELAGRESENRVLESLAQAIGTTRDRRAVPVLLALTGHPDADVRRRTACAFAGVATGSADGPDVHALIALTRDADPEVRDWATFTLGFQLDADSPAIRAALWERTGDDSAEAREEGIRGLARRHDPRAVPLLTELLRDPEGALTLTFDAARIMGVPQLLPALQDYDPENPGVAAALNACDPARRARLDADAWELVCELHRRRPDLGAAVLMSRFDDGLTLHLATGPEASGYCVEALLARAGGDVAGAVELVVSDLPGSGTAATAGAPSQL